MTRTQISLSEGHSILANTDVIEISLLKVPTKVLLALHVHHSLVLLTEHSPFAFLLVALWLFKREVFCSGENTVDPEQILICKAECISIASELQIVTTRLQRLGSVFFLKCVMGRYIRSELTTHIVREIHENETYLHFHVTTNLLELIW